MSKRKLTSGPVLVLTGEHRLNKLLAAAGLGSRRQCEELIEQGRVEVDGEIVTSLSKKADSSKSKIVVDGTNLRQHRPVYFAVNKPSGVLCTNRDPQGRPRVIDLVPGHARLFPVGRLDSSSIGLILLTNDGELAQRLAHPSYGVPKTYFVVVQGQVQPQDLAKLRKGIYLAEGVARVEGAKIRRVRKGATELEIVLTEGKNREIRRVLARFGHKVVVLRRLAIGPLRLGLLPEGMHRPLTSIEVASLYRAADDAKRAKPKPKTASKISNPDLSKPRRIAKTVVAQPGRNRLEGPANDSVSLVEVRPPQLDGHDMDAQFSRHQGGVIAFDDDDESVDAGGGSLDDELLDDYDSDDEMPATPAGRARGKKPLESDPGERRGKRSRVSKAGIQDHSRASKGAKGSGPKRSATQQFMSRSEASRQLTAPKGAQPTRRAKGSSKNRRTELGQRNAQPPRSSKGDSRTAVKAHSKSASVSPSSRSILSRNKQGQGSSRTTASLGGRQPAKKTLSRSGDTHAAGRGDSRNVNAAARSGVRRGSNTKRSRKK